MLFYILLSDKIDFKLKITIREKRYLIMIKGLAYQTDTMITYIYICAPNKRTPKLMTQKLTVLKGDTDNSKMIIDFNTLLSVINRITRQEINKKTILE